MVAPESKPIVQNEVDPLDAFRDQGERPLLERLCDRTRELGDAAKSWFIDIVTPNPEDLRNRVGQVIAKNRESSTREMILDQMKHLPDVPLVTDPITGVRLDPHQVLMSLPKDYVRAVPRYGITNKEDNPLPALEPWDEAYAKAVVEVYLNLTDQDPDDDADRNNLSPTLTGGIACSPMDLANRDYQAVRTSYLLPGHEQPITINGKYHIAGNEPQRTTIGRDQVAFQDAETGLNGYKVVGIDTLLGQQPDDQIMDINTLQLLTDNGYNPTSAAIISY